MVFLQPRPADMVGLRTRCRIGLAEQHSCRFTLVGVAAHPTAGQLIGVRSFNVKRKGSIGREVFSLVIDRQVAAHLAIESLSIEHVVVTSPFWPPVLFQIWLTAYSPPTGYGSEGLSSMLHDARHRARLHAKLVFSKFILFIIVFVFLKLVLF